MLKATLTAVLVVALGIATATAQPASPAPPQQERSIVGLPVFSSDGEKLGEVIHVGRHEGGQAVVAEMSGFLGTREAVMFPANIVTAKDGRVEIAMTAEEIRDTVANAESNSDRR